MTIIADQERNQRARAIAGLRALATLLEQIPELPAPDAHQITWCIGGSDAKAIPIIKSTVEALAAANVPHDVADGHSLELTVPLDGLEVRLFHVYDQRMVEYAARTSYRDVIQLDDKAGA